MPKPLTVWTREQDHVEWKVASSRNVIRAGSLVVGKEETRPYIHICIAKMEKLYTVSKSKTGS